MAETTVVANVTEIVIKGMESLVVGYACPSCGQIYQILDPKTADSTRETASKCCPPKVCPQCGTNPVVRGQPLCTACGAHAAQEGEARRFAAATKVSEASWPGPVYWPNAPFDGDNGGQYWSTIAKLRVDCSSRVVPVPLPQYVYATRLIPFRVAAVDAIDKALDAQSESFVVPAAELARLQKLLDDWAANQKTAAYEEDLSKAVVLG